MISSKLNNLQRRINFEFKEIREGWPTHSAVTLAFLYKDHNTPCKYSGAPYTLYRSSYWFEKPPKEKDYRESFNNFMSRINKNITWDTKFFTDYVEAL
jgi:hypothetical protein